MKRKQVLAFILSVSMLASTSVGSVSFAKEGAEESLKVQETISFREIIIMNGGEVSGNTAPWGGGMFCWQDTDITIGGKAEIKGNTATTANGVTAEVDDFIPASGAKRQVIIQDKDNTQNLQSLNKRMVTFMEKADTAGRYDEIYVLPNEKIATDQIPKAEKVDNKLLGWRNLKDDKDWDFATDTVTEDTVLYPVWKSTAKYYTDRYDTGSKNATIADTQVKEGNKAREPEMTWTGNTLQGWYTTEDFQTRTAERAVSEQNTRMTEKTILIREKRIRKRR